MSSESDFQEAAENFVLPTEAEESAVMDEFRQAREKQDAMTDDEWEQRMVLLGDDYKDLGKKARP